MLLTNISRIISPRALWLVLSFSQTLIAPAFF